MQIEKLKEKEEELSQKQVSDLFMSIIMGKDVTEIFHSTKGDFKIKFPRMKDLEEIGRKTAFRLNGIPARCFDVNTYNLMQQIATLDVVVVEGPDWYEKAKKKNISFSWQDIPSIDLVREVYAFAYEFREKEQSKIDENQRTEYQQLDNNGNGDNDSQPGLFEGLSGES